MTVNQRIARMAKLVGSIDADVANKCEDADTVKNAVELARHTRIVRDKIVARLHAAPKERR